NRNTDLFMNRNELANKIRGIDGLTNDEKSALIELLRKQKKYGLVWEDKPEDVEERLREELPVLIEDAGKAIVSEDADAPNHILIEGDNLEALTALAYTHEGKIDVIYIDPPYNTGNKDFVYNDQFVDKEDSYRHSKWLSFMSRRLRIAKRLLSDKGVIFISIDDNEQAQLKLLCDEVFNQNNYVGEFAWQKRKGGGNDSAYIAIDHEYVLVYANSIFSLDEKWRIPYEAEYLKRYNKEDANGRFYYDTLSRPGLNNPIIYDVVCPDGSIIKKGTWQISEETFKVELAKGNVDFIKNKQGGYTVVHKVRIPERGRVIRSIISDVSNKDAADEMFDIFGNKKIFSNPKPKDLIYKLILLSSKTNSTILDFFAGSGTTLHATMQLNAEDGGHRKCILVTNNENNICEEVTYERNKRVIQGYTTPKGEEVPGLTGNTLRYYKTDFISRDRTPRNMRALVAASTDLLCIKNDIYKEAKLAGRDINPKIARYFAEGDRSMLVIYDERAISAIVEILETVEPGKEKIMVYVFSAGSYAYDDEFEEVADKVQLCALPDAIYQAYQKVLPKRRPKFLPEAMEENERSNSPENGMLNFTDEEAEV
ncbi:site-specific DNA-methyltransferase, partial [uncultured Bacteroides sp.]|uniref:site-specific DNA-methyltransferase n=1 Tax=uncultured Bacteroides sp. TaxID=162156 RepID=UPI0034530039